MCPKMFKVIKLLLSYCSLFQTLERKFLSGVLFFGLKLSIFWLMQSKTLLISTTTYISYSIFVFLESIKLVLDWIFYVLSRSHRHKLGKELVERVGIPKGTATEWSLEMNLKGWIKRLFQKSSVVQFPQWSYKCYQLGSEIFQSLTFWIHLLKML